MDGSSLPREDVPMVFTTDAARITWTLNRDRIVDGLKLHT